MWTDQAGSFVQTIGQPEGGRGGVLHGVGKSENSPLPWERGLMTTAAGGGRTKAPRRPAPPSLLLLTVALQMNFSRMRVS